MTAYEKSMEFGNGLPDLTSTLGINGVQKVPNFLSAPPSKSPSEDAWLIWGDHGRLRKMEFSASDCSPNCTINVQICEPEHCSCQLNTSKDPELNSTCIYYYSKSFRGTKNFVDNLDSHPINIPYGKQLILTIIPDDKTSVIAKNVFVNVVVTPPENNDGFISEMKDLVQIAKSTPIPTLSIISDTNKLSIPWYAYLIFAIVIVIIFLFFKNTKKSEKKIIPDGGRKRNRK